MTSQASSGSDPIPWSELELLVFDFDGVMTDNRVLVDENGVESVWVNRGDGWGIARLKERGVPMLVLSTEQNRVVAARCRKLGIECVQGSDDKRATLMELVTLRGFSPAHVAYVGNDVNDLACMQWVGIPIAVADAEPEVLKVARYTTTRRGGYGAVREIAELILATLDGTG